MKREILCAPCLKDWNRAVHPPSTKMISVFEGAEIADEWQRRKTGPALRNFICDGCGQAIRPGDNVNAVSMGNSRAPYREWEHEYIEVQP